MKNKKIKNLIFDWSGTLSDDLTPVYKATIEVFKKYVLSLFEKLVAAFTQTPTSTHRSVTDG